MLMQVLVAGGITPLVDDLRPADVDNPRGYFEYEPATRFATTTPGYHLPAERWSSSCCP